MCRLQSTFHLEKEVGKGKSQLSLSLSPSIFLIQLTDEWIITSLSLSLSPSLSHPSFVLLSSVGMKCFAVLRDVRTREREIRGQPTRRLAPSRVLAPLVPLVEAIPEFCQWIGEPCLVECRWHAGWKSFEIWSSSLVYWWPIGFQTTVAEKEQRTKAIHNGGGKELKAILEGELKRLGSIVPANNAVLRDR